MFSITSEDGQARAGALKTLHGTLETPAFLPVATRAVGRFVAADDYRQANVPAIIANAFLLAHDPGIETFKNGIHRFMHFDGVIFTDCGGFQMLRKNLLLDTTTNGVWFRTPMGKRTFVRPETVVTIGKQIGGDVVMALDCVLPYGKTRTEYIDALKKSHHWSKRCRDLHDSKQLLFGITQGGTFGDLREASAKAINAMGFDGNAIGGLGIGEPAEVMYQMLTVSVSSLDKEKPRYVMGIGKPSQILECVERGIDIFDSIYPQKNARHGRLFTFNGILDLGKERYKFDEKPIDDACSCATCRTFSRAYLRYLLKKQDPVGKRYLTIHNLFFMQDLMKQIQERIKDGDYRAFKESVLKKISVIQ